MFLQELHYNKNKISSIKTTSEGSLNLASSVNFRFPLEILKNSEFTRKIGHRHGIVLS